MFSYTEMDSSSHRVCFVFFFVLFFCYKSKAILAIVAAPMADQVARFESWSWSFLGGKGAGPGGGRGRSRLAKGPNGDSWNRRRQKKGNTAK